MGGADDAATYTARATLSVWFVPESGVKDSMSFAHLGRFFFRTGCVLALLLGIAVVPILVSPGENAWQLIAVLAASAAVVWLFGFFVLSVLRRR